MPRVLFRERFRHIRALFICRPLACLEREIVWSVAVAARQRGFETNLYLITKHAKSFFVRYVKFVCNLKENARLESLAQSKRGERMSVTLDLAANLMRVSGNVISILRMMCCTSFARFVRAVAFFIMLLSIANGDLCAADGLSDHLFPASIFTLDGGESRMAPRDQAPMAALLDEWPVNSGLTKISGETAGAANARWRKGSGLVFVGSHVLPRMGNPTLLVQMKKREPPLTYFLSERPVDLSLSTLPANAQNVLVARVRLPNPLLYLRGRTIQSMSPPPSDLYLATLEILSVLQGEAPSESRPLVTFWPRENARLDIPPAVPWTPKQLATEYFVVMYSDSKGLHLAGFPMSDAAYHEWEQEGSEYHRELRNSLLPKR